jgi:BirA family biotin operon repressor/biotin-[acetyl-CoA-carboxylase] ligase
LKLSGKNTTLICTFVTVIPFCNFNANLIIIEKTDRENDLFSIKWLIIMIIGSNLLFFENLPSTNTHTVSILKKNNLTEGTIIYTNYQSAGRGQMGNRWESEDSKNLLISILLFPSFLNPADQFFISMTISLGICDFITRFIRGCSIKWPNDIYVNNDKIAGILLESSIKDNQIEYTVAGIGLNINQEKFSDYLPNPVSLRILSRQSYDLKSCLDQLGADLDKRYKQLIAGQFAQIRDEYVSKLYRLSNWFAFKDINGIYTGRILTITEYGRLQIERQNGRLSEYSFKEVEFIP